VRVLKLEKGVFHNAEKILDYAKQKHVRQVEQCKRQRWSKRAALLLLMQM
jgi:hypothetical protein